MQIPPSINLSERFFEANFYSEVAHEWHPCRLTWFTPSTVDEAKLAFDTYSSFGGRFFFFQFKFPKAWRSRRAICLGKHMYLQSHADHEQMTALQELAAIWPPQTVLYAMPAFVSVAAPRILPVTHYLDVLSLPSTLSAPSTSRGTLRKSGEHQLNLCPACGQWEVRSEPFRVRARTVDTLVEEFRDPLSAATAGSSERPAGLADLSDLLARLDSTVRGLLVSPPT